MARVEIYMKSTCGFCYRALKLLDAKGADYQAYELTWGSPLREEMIQRAGKRIAARDYRASEFAGACFDPAGKTLFVNLQHAGITFAIWGPWDRGTF